MKKSMLDEKGVDFLGMRLIVVLIAAALLLAAASVYLEGYVDRSSRDQARREASRIAGLAVAEYAAGSPGSAAPVSVAIPCCVKRITFAGNAYSIEFADGSNETHISSCPFLPATLYPGEYGLYLKIVDNGTYAVSLEAQDAR